MKIENTIDLILKISEKFEKCDKATTSETHYEVLHCALDKVLSEYTKEQYESLPEHMRATLLKLECNILDCCSAKYVNKVYENRNKHSRFAVPKNNNNVRAVTKYKQTIGFIVEADEGLNI